MAADYATLADLKAHWSTLPVADEVEAAQKLHEASVEVHGMYPDLDARIIDGAMDPDVPRLVVCRMVKRAMDTPEWQVAGVGQMQNTTGPFGQTLTFTNPDGNVYLSKSDKALLSAGRVKGKAFTIHLGGW